MTTDQDDDDKTEAHDGVSRTASVLRFLFVLIRPHWRVCVLIGLLSAVASIADVLAPLIYRTAINDVSGLFVAGGEHGTPAGTPATTPARPPASPPAGPPASPPAAPPTSPPPSAPVVAPPPSGAPHAPTAEHAPTRRHRPAPKAHVKEPHGKGHVASRTAHEVIAGLLVAVGFLFLINVLANLFALLADSLGARLASMVESTLIADTFRRLLAHPLGFFGRRASAALVKQVDQTDSVSPLIMALVKEVTPQMFTVIGVMVMMTVQNTELALVVLAPLVPYLWVSRRMRQRLASGLPAYYERWDEVSVRLQEAVAGVKTVKLSGAEGREVNRMERTLAAAYGEYLRRNSTENRYLFAQALLMHLGRALVLAYGGWQVLDHQLTPGDVVMFVVYLDTLFDPLDEITRMAAAVQQYFASLARARRLMDDGEAEPGGGPVPDGPGRVEFDDVWFGYAPDRPVLQGLSLVLEAGKVTALVGPSGAGKTTTADLLLRLREPQRGEIRLDGVPVSTMAPAAIRGAIGVVSADGALFRGTVADNIRYKRPDATDAEVLEAARSVGLGRMLDRLEGGLAHQLGDAGGGLSVGERQRLQIARVLVSRPRILILDEATANLDFATESEVKDALRELRGTCTTLVIAHRFSMVEDVDRVYVLAAGQIVQAGEVAGLAGQEGWFGKFAASSRGPGAASPPT